MSDTAWIRWTDISGARLEAGEVGQGGEVEARIGDVDRHVQAGRCVYIAGPGGPVLQRDGAGRGPIDPAHPFEISRGNVRAPR